jgi:hypothetical protein
VGCGMQNPAVTGPKSFVPDTTNNNYKKRTLLLLLIASELNTIACCGKNLMQLYESSVWLLPIKSLRAGGILSCWL